MSPYDPYAKIVNAVYNDETESIGLSCVMQFNGEVDRVTVIITNQGRKEEFEPEITYEIPGLVNLTVRGIKMIPGSRFGISIEVRIQPLVGREFITPSMPYVYIPSNNPNANNNMRRYMY